MDELINRLKIIIPDIKFRVSDSYCWSPSEQSIHYIRSHNYQTRDAWPLLHEAGHAVLKHQNYASDIELVILEADAWSKAKELGQKLGLVIDENHIQDCIDTYRDWLHQRSTCPRCGVVSLQTSPCQYDCHNCTCTWTVSAARFCRPYRLIKEDKTKRPLGESKTSVATFS
jgi:hypothetical protein